MIRIAARQVHLLAREENVNKYPGQICNSNLTTQCSKALFQQQNSTSPHPANDGRDWRTAILPLVFACFAGGAAFTAIVCMLAVKIKECRAKRRGRRQERLRNRAGRQTPAALTANNPGADSLKRRISRVFSWGTKGPEVQTVPLGGVTTGVPTTSVPVSPPSRAATTNPPPYSRMPIPSTLAADPVTPPPYDPRDASLSWQNQNPGSDVESRPATPPPTYNRNPRDHLDEEDLDIGIDSDVMEQDESSEAETDVDFYSWEVDETRDATPEPAYVRRYS